MKIVCEHDVERLSCDAGSVLTIKSADYGRLNNRYCRNGRYGVQSGPMNPPEACRHDVTDIVRGW